MARKEERTEIMRRLRKLLPQLSGRYGVRSLAIFGSRISGTPRQSSDLDFLATFEDTPGLLKFIGLENELTDPFGLKVDFVMEDALKPDLRPRILAGAIAV